MKTKKNQKNITEILVWTNYSIDGKQSSLGEKHSSSSEKRKSDEINWS